MLLQDQIHSDLKRAMIEKNEPVKSLLRVIIGEFNREESKNLQDEKVISIIKKMVESCKLTNNTNEVVILERYLPIQLNESQLSVVISSIITVNGYTIKDMGKIMSILKDKYAGQYDGKLASSLVKSLLMV